LIDVVAARTRPLWGAVVRVRMVIRLSSPPTDGRLAFLMQLVGWLVAVGGVYALLTAISRSRFSANGKRPRHPNGREASRRHAIRLVVATVLAVLTGGWFLWWGIDDGIRSVFCVGLVVLSAAPILLARAAASVREVPAASG
jgi:hypothetical protein